MPNTSIVYTCGESSEGVINVVSSLFGKKITSLSGGGDGLFAASTEGTFSIADGSLLSLIDLSSISYGKTHNIALSSTKSVYTWGEKAMYGELGLGALMTEAKSPMPVKILKEVKVKSISSGYSHSAALDINGNLYTWGQNFDRQLGHFRKTKEALPAGCMVEEMVMAPRMVAFSLLNPIISVSCGSNFTAVVTKTGQIWSWGSGESGQLGIGGRCTFKDIPTKCDSTETFAQVACGFAHTVAVTSTGVLYSWGFNKRGQLGLGEGNVSTMQSPASVAMPEGRRNIFDINF